jgi:hypothetical protein
LLAGRHGFLAQGAGRASRCCQAKLAASAWLTLKKANEVLDDFYRDPIHVKDRADANPSRILDLWRHAVSDRDRFGGGVSYQGRERHCADVLLLFQPI